MYPMRNPIRRYAWGSTEALPALLGVTPDGGPQAELWLGAHESEPSSVRIDQRWHDLAAVLRARGESPLPYLAKVTAIGSPLSLQIHPRGPDAKTEMLYAWQPCRVLCGFRDAGTVRSLLTDLVAAPCDGRLGAMLDQTRSQSALRDCLALLLRTFDEALVADVRARLRRLPRWATVATAVEELAAHHGGDPAVLAPLLVADVELAAGEAIVCRPGQPHTYLSGVGIEVQSSSDAVLRAGLTSKPVDVDGFLAGLTTRPGASRVRARGAGPEWVYAPSDTGFALGVVGDVPDEPASRLSSVEGAQILLCVEGAYTIAVGGAELELRPGGSAFVPGPRPVVDVRGKGCLFRVSTDREG